MVFSDVGAAIGIMIAALVFMVIVFTNSKDF